MVKVLISDKISESAIQIFKNNNIEVDYKPGISEDELNNIISEFLSHKLNQIGLENIPQIYKEISKKKKLTKYEIKIGK